MRLSCKTRMKLLAAILSLLAFGISSAEADSDRYFLFVLGVFGLRIFLWQETIGPAQAVCLPLSSSI